MPDHAAVTTPAGHMVSVDRHEWDQLLETLDYLRARDRHLSSLVARWAVFSHEVDRACKLADVHVELDHPRADLAALLAAAPAVPAALERPPACVAAPAA